MNKRGAIELSLNFIVIIIISIVLFAFGVGFIYNLASKASDITDFTLDDLDKKIGNLVCEGFDRVCIGEERKTIEKKDFDVFGIKILNILDEDRFIIFVENTGPAGAKILGYDKQNNPMPVGSSPQLIVVPSYGVLGARDITILKNQERNFAVAVQVPADAKAGTYILDVIIQTESGQDYVPVQKLYIDVP
jgi:hypothetical protein